MNRAMFTFFIALLGACADSNEVSYRTCLKDWYNRCIVIDTCTPCLDGCVETGDGGLECLHPPGMPAGPDLPVSMAESEAEADAIMCEAYRGQLELCTSTDLSWLRACERSRIEIGDIDAAFCEP